MGGFTGRGKGPSNCMIEFEFHTFARHIKGKHVLAKEGCRSRYQVDDVALRGNEFRRHRSRMIARVTGFAVLGLLMKRNLLSGFVFVCFVVRDRSTILQSIDHVSRIAPLASPEPSQWHPTCPCADPLVTVGGKSRFINAEKGVVNGFDQTTALGGLIG
jgi:hypothetical protein